MKPMDFSTPWDFSRSSYSGWTRSHWEEAFQRMFAAIHRSASPSGARQRLPGPRSHHGLLADELEGFTRSFIMAGPWLMNHSDGVFTLEGETYDVGKFYQKGILAGTDPSHEEYWGDIYDFAQHLVEMASLAWSLYQGKRHIWDRFSDGEKAQVAAYLNSVNQVQYHQNNWLLFNVVTNTVLKKLGMPYSEENIQKNLAACDSMYMGQGWYRDGNINRIDYYNSWAFHYYYLIWALLDGDSNPALAAQHQQRVKEFVRDFRYFFDKDGSVPCFGRSMIYRFGYLSSIALGMKMGALDIDPGEVKTMLNLGMKFYFDRPIFTDSGHLSMGFIAPSATILEHYSCGGSPYWAVKAFNLLMLSEEDPFWQTHEKPLPIHKGNYTKSLLTAGLSLNGDSRSGHVQLINQKSFHDKAEYNSKYTNFAYSSRFSYESRVSWGNINCDNSLQWSEDRIFYFQRWKFDLLHMEDRWSLSQAPTSVLEEDSLVYGVDPEGKIRTLILQKNNSYLTFHRIQSSFDLALKEGGYPLGFDRGTASKTVSLNSSMVEQGDRISFIRNLFGWEMVVPAEAFNDDVQGSNCRFARSLTPRLECRSSGGSERYLASHVVGLQGRASMKQLEAMVASCEFRDGQFEVVFFDAERYRIDLNSSDPAKSCLKL